MADGCAMCQFPWPWQWLTQPRTGLLKLCCKSCHLGARDAGISLREFPMETYGNHWNFQSFFKGCRLWPLYLCSFVSCEQFCEVSLGTKLDWEEPEYHEDQNKLSWKNTMVAPWWGVPSHSTSTSHQESDSPVGADASSFRSTTTCQWWLGQQWWFFFGEQDAVVVHLFVPFLGHKKLNMALTCSVLSQLSSVGRLRSQPHASSIHRWW